jgi:hypothetical protein
MVKLLLGVVIEVFVAVSLAGLILALVIPLLNRGGLPGANDTTTTIMITGVLICVIAVALFRPGSAIHRYMKR